MTKCARCAAPLESTDATADAVSKAHEERCFVVGDAVAGGNVGDRRWFEGVIESTYDCGYGDGSRGCSIRLARGSAQYTPGDRIGYSDPANLRRIPRPEQAVKASLDTMLDAHYPRDADGKHYLHSGVPVVSRRAPATRPRSGAVSWRIVSRARWSGRR